MLLLSHDQGSDGIAKAMGKEGDLIGEMYKVSFPRSDLTVMVKNVAIKPALALMGWAGFIQSGSTAVTYGDLVVLEDENLRREVQLAAASRARGGSTHTISVATFWTKMLSASDCVTRGVVHAVRPALKLCYFPNAAGGGGRS